MSRGTCWCGRAAFRRGLCQTCYRAERRTGVVQPRATDQPPALFDLEPEPDTSPLIEDLEWILDSGETHPEAIAHRLGYTAPKHLYAALRRNQRDDLIDRMRGPDQ